MDHISNGTRCPYCANKKVLPGYNDLATFNPPLAKEWDYEKNGDLKPQDFMPNSNKKAWWICEKGHEWEASICDRNNGNGCPVCASKIVLRGFNDLATTNPQLAKEWNYEKNGDLKPQDFTSGSGKKAWWKCRKGHEWETAISNRSKRGSGCPYCSGHKAILGETDLTTLNPKLASEWNYKRNGSLKPQDSTLSSNRTVWWKCSKGHEWRASITNRNKGRNCPFCGNKKILPGYNDLETTNPKLAKEWNFKKNGKLKPSDVFAKSGRKAWWICEKGHEWEATIASRSGGNNCPVCSQNLRVSFPEKALFFYIKRAFSDAVENYKAQWLGKKELDIYVPSIKTGIEFDGVWYHNDTERDIEKDKLCRKHGVTLIRIREKGLSDEGLKSTVFTLPEELNNKIERLTPGLKFLEKRLKVNFDISLSRDYDEVRSMVTNFGLENCIAKTHPELLDEWDYEKNGQVGNTPENVSFGASVIIWWKCKNGHSYRVKLNSKTSSHTGCPYCANKKVLKGFNDLATVKPEIAKEWNYEKNGSLKPDNVLSGSHKKVWWKCSECGREWETSPELRRNTRCGKCNRKDLNVKLVSGVNDLYTAAPDVAEMWNYEKNDGLNPKNVTVGSGKKVWWKCSRGHEWEAIICNITGHKSGCPYCSGRKLTPGVNDLATINPKLAAEWNYEKNGNLKPRDFTPGNGTKVWWKCSRGHEWKSVIGSRNSGVGCPYCAGKKVLEGYNDLATTHPALLGEWDYNKNTNIKPTEISFGSDEKIWWRCANKHEWAASVSERVHGRGCPYCSNKRVLKGFNDLKTRKPEIAEEWNYERNGNLRPEDVAAGFSGRVWWKCSKCGEEWASAPYNRKNVNCKNCNQKKAKMGTRDPENKR